ncbi:hypothetical protein NDA11_007484 [Ustilago hordei]|uniref:Conserved uncharacterized protein n=1 Tax=Ustilago hordei TaxID=120017 RepID=I2G5R0_USTHO|nr:uncharacterized protein UHO2_01768 [Ustilago hordei]KAJ1039373.1 hypothetical protein NDA10_002596 [Ustilago hordei]KAJ1585963.1 hypothetical protein NDA12_003581 [Ustilago hordei]KAJ1589544.1 hypothetical protein NDA15_006393 [Ustilago hordei]KAJ1591240.1 hypothetical protein NDA11_007484 [Ustilago hordei]KAJ1600984.1 hypothetical protein NDA14_005717 [Ustilago hordei]
MKTTFSTILIALALAGSGVLASPAPSQPGYGLGQPHNPTGLWGLKCDPVKYHTLCDRYPLKPSHDHRPRACFDTELILKNKLSAPNPETLQGYIDGSETNMVLYAGQIVTLNEELEIHVEEAKHADQRDIGCSRVLIYHLPKWSKQLEETWCPHQDDPIKL